MRAPGASNAKRATRPAKAPDVPDLPGVWGYPSNLTLPLWPISAASGQRQQYRPDEHGEAEADGELEAVEWDQRNPCRTVR